MKRGPKPRPVPLRPRWLAQYQAGAINLTELARRAGVSSTTAYEELRRRGIDTSRGKRATCTVARAGGGSVTNFA